MKGLTRLLLLTLLLAGCAHAPRPAASRPRPVVTPDLRPLGRVEMVNEQGRFVVVSFGAGETPAVGQMLDILHKGLKIGEARVSGPQHQLDTVADIIAGDANVGDDAQAQ